MKTVYHHALYRHLWIIGASCVMTVGGHGALIPFCFLVGVQVLIFLALFFHLMITDPDKLQTVVVTSEK